MHNRRLVPRSVGDRKFLFNTFLTVFSLVFFTGAMVLVTNMGVLSRAPDQTPLLGKVLASSILTLFLLLLVSVVVTHFYSHRVAGPMHRLQNSLQDILKGNWPGPVNFRQSDDFQKVGEVLNAVLKQIEDRLKRSSSQSDRIEAELEEALQQASRRPSEKEAKEAMENIVRHLETAQTSLKKLRVELRGRS